MARRFWPAVALMTARASRSNRRRVGAPRTASSRVVATPPSGADADDPLERPCECGLVAESRSVRHFNEGLTRLCEELLGVLDPQASEPAMAGHPEARLEGTREMTDR